MATIYDEILAQFNEKLSSEKFNKMIIDDKVDKQVYDAAINTLIGQIKSLRKKNFEDTSNQVSTDASALINTIDRIVENEIN